MDTITWNTTRIPVLYEDEDMLVLNKPSGIATSIERKSEEVTIEKIIGQKEPFSHLPRAGIVHRLDADTSGVLLLAKHERALAFFQDQFTQRQIQKTYLTLLAGVLSPREGRIETFLDRSPSQRTKQKAYALDDPLGKEKDMRRAVTEYVVREYYTFDRSPYSFVEASPKTGRKHQLRAHFAFLSHPIVGDALYGFRDTPKIPNLSRQFLHAYALKIRMLAGQERKFTVDLPYELQTILEGMKLTEEL